ncbi:MAG: alpha/beta hydrolase, partial [Epsilonproteobacteria bacterium]|nr:alpha/beta hydrolase [Campylobacterota bacterium]
MRLQAPPLMKLLLFGLLLYLIALLYLYIFQERLIFRPDLAPKEVELPKGAKQLFIEGIEVGIMDRKSDGTIFYFGGNADNALRALGYFSDLPYNIVSFNYPGFGHSKGNPSQEAILEAAKKIFDRFKTKKNILIGRSLGSGVAGYIAANYPVQGL